MRPTSSKNWRFVLISIVKNEACMHAPKSTVQISTNGLIFLGVRWGDSASDSASDSVSDSVSVLVGDLAGKTLT